MFLSLASGYLYRRTRSIGVATMPEESTTAIVQRYLGELTGEAPFETVMRMLLDRAVLRLQRLCATLLHHDYPRLTHPPLNLQTDEPLSAVVERLLKALREARPRVVREFLRPGWPAHAVGAE
jgi:RNA polymerase sigma-70 factor (ECF subfamily)